MLTTCLAAADSRPTSRVGLISGWPEPGEQPAGVLDLVPPVHEAAGRVLVAEMDVVRDGEPLDEVELLVDGRDAQPQRRDRVREAHRRPLPEHLALVGLVRAGEHLDQRGLAGAVLAEQAVHLARAHRQVDAVERAHAGELLDDAAHLQQRDVVHAASVRVEARPGRFRWC